MPQTSAPKLHLNEHLSPRLAEQLRKHGFDATTSQEQGLLTVSDEEQLAHAASQQRAIVTLNVADFADLHESYLAGGTEHWGIVFSTPLPIGVMLRRLLRLLHSVSADELRSQVRWLNDFR